MANQWRRGFGILIFALLLLNYAASVHQLYQRGQEGYSGLHGEGNRDKVVVTAIDEGSPGAGKLRVGDELIALNGVYLKDDLSVLNRPDPAPGGSYTITVLREGQLLTFSITTVRKPNPYPLDRVAGRFTDLLFLAIGIFIFFFRLDDKQAQVLGLMLGTFTALNIGSPPAWPLWAVELAFVAQFFGLFFLPLSCHLFLIFPEASPLLRRWPSLERWIYLPFLVFVLPNYGITRLLRPPVTMLAGRLSDALPGWYKLLTSVTLILYIAGAVLFIIINYQAASTAAKRKLRVLVAGCGLGFLTFLLLVTQELLRLGRSFPQFVELVGEISLVTIPLIPLTFAYAIIRHQVIPISLIIRRGVRYLLVSRGSILLLLAGVGALMWVVMDDVFRYFHLSNGRTVGTVSALVAILVWRFANSFHQQIIAPAIDRHFFHQAYDAQQIIAELNDSLRTVSDLPHLLELVATRMQSAVKAETVSVFLRNEKKDAFELAYHCVYSHHKRRCFRKVVNASLAKDLPVIQYLQETAQPLALDEYDARFSLSADKLNSSMFLSEVQKVTDLLETRLLIPILGKDGLVAIFSLGKHLGDLPYSTEDKRLLLSVGAPTTLALENARLIERMVADERRRQELEAENEARARELEEARQLQLSMLPKQVPQLPALEIAAYMKTATEVGGDYYDFDLAADGTLTVAVGDATGHGLKAGTVVTAMKSLFRTFAREADPASILKQSSRVLKEMNLRSLFMALTVLKFKDGRLKFSAAGMPAMLIYRRDSHCVEEVFLPAMPLGSLSSYPYRQVELEVATGDVVVILSDGFPERFNMAGEILGYARAAAVLREIADYSAKEIIARYVAVGDEWANGRAQDDDVTFVVLKIKSSVEKV